MFELASRLLGVYKVNNMVSIAQVKLTEVKELLTVHPQTRSVAIANMSLSWTNARTDNNRTPRTYPIAVPSSVEP